MIHPQIPYAIVVTTSAADLGGAVTLAAPLRCGDIVVQTPLAHSQTTRQIRRAYGSGARFVLVLDGTSVETIDVRDGSRTTTGIDEAAERVGQAETADRARVVPVTFGRFPLPQAA